ncbi:hypothetical protein CR513_36938, partial [Mucuna pruriens]
MCYNMLAYIVINTYEYVGGHTKGTKERKHEEATPALESPITRVRLKRIQEEVKYELAWSRAKRRPKKAKAIFIAISIASPRWLGKVEENPRGRNKKLVTLKGQEEGQESEVLYHVSSYLLSNVESSKNSIFHGRKLSESSRSSWSSVGEKRERHVWMERNRREERRERHWRRGEEPREEELDKFKFKIPLFLGNWKLKVYVDWELKDIRREIREPCESWRDLKGMMRKRFKSTIRRLEMDLMRAQIRESEEATMARFLHGLNGETQVDMELQH